jgi:hypothetical protein
MNFFEDQTDDQTDDTGVNNWLNSMKSNQTLNTITNKPPNKNTEKAKQYEEWQSENSKGIACSFLMYSTLQGFMFGVFIVTLFYLIGVGLWIYFSKCASTTSQYVAYTFIGVLSLICAIGAWSYGREFNTITLKSYKEMKEKEFEASNIATKNLGNTLKTRGIRESERERERKRER